MGESINHKGFTLIEIAVTTIVLFILTWMAVPTFNNMQDRASAKNAFQNLLTIYLAQQDYYRKHGSFCTGTDCNDVNKINTVLGLNIVNINRVEYDCSLQVGSEFFCRAGWTCNPITTNCSSGIVVGAFQMKIGLTMPIVSSKPVYCSGVNPNGTLNPCCNATVPNSGKIAGEMCP